MRKVMWRLIPILIICYFVAFVDRTNVSFAGLLMNKELGFSSAVYGLGAGIFFWGYCLFEIPSNLILARVGARVWIARILITWGIISGLTALVWSAYSFYGIRFLLGVAESGFYPGIILFLTWWFPKRYRARAIGLFMTAIAGSQIVGSIISGELLKLDGIWGLGGWQWLFILEAVPAVILGFVVYFALTNSLLRRTGCMKTSANGSPAGSRSSGGNRRQSGISSSDKLCGIRACGRLRSCISGRISPATGWGYSCPRLFVASASAWRWLVGSPQFRRFSASSLCCFRPGTRITRATGC